MTSNALTGTRDHCRRMATALHTDDCFALVPVRWGGTTTKRPNPDCTGCVPESDRALFAQLAGEIDAYLSGDPTVVTAPTADDVPLDGITWGDVQDAARTALALHYLGGHPDGLPCLSDGHPDEPGHTCRFEGTGVPQADDSEAVQS